MEGQADGYTNSNLNTAASADLLACLPAYLSACRDSEATQLAAGEQQRALLARALVQKADLLLLDEPFTYLDPPTRQQLLAVLRQQAAQGRIVLVSSHDWGDSLQGYDRALLLDTTLRADDRPARVLERLQRP